MRVVSGSARGIRLESLEGLDTRPTVDRVKESMFSMIQSSIYGSRGLDLFSGSGALGIELLSRGAISVCFVEANRMAAAIIEKNLERTKLFHKSRLIVDDVNRALHKLKGNSFDIIVMDPPYLKGYIKTTLLMIHECELLSEHGIIVVEHEFSDPEIEVSIEGFEMLKNKKYGKIGITIFGRKR